MRGEAVQGRSPAFIPAPGIARGWYEGRDTTGPEARSHLLHMTPGLWP
jgi:hypothetical protein